MKRTLIFVALTFGITWGIQIPAGIMLGTFTAGETSAPIMLGIIAVTMFVPLLAALIANKIVGPSERINLAIRPLISSNIKTYLIAWFGPIVLTLLGYVVYFLANPQLFDPNVALRTIEEQGVEIDPGMVPLMISSTLVSAIVVAPFINAIVAFGEEAGWRGMLFPSLAERFSTRTAIVVSGVIWGLWHAPVIAMGHNFGMDYLGFPVFGILVMTLTCTFFGAFLAWLRMRSGSVWPCALAHGAFNAFANFGSAVCVTGNSPFGPTPLGLVAGIPLIVVGLVVLVKCGKK